MKFASNESARDVLRPRVVPFGSRLRDEASRAGTASRGGRDPLRIPVQKLTEQWGAAHAPLMGGENRRAVGRTTREDSGSVAEADSVAGAEAVADPRHRCDGAAMHGGRPRTPPPRWSINAVASASSTRT